MYSMNTRLKFFYKNYSRFFFDVLENINGNLISGTLGEIPDQQMYSGSSSKFEYNVNNAKQVLKDKILGIAWMQYF